MAGRRYVPPAPGRMARRVSGSATLTLLVKRRSVVVRASSSPPPKAGAWTAERVGIGRCWICVNVRRTDVRNCFVLGYYLDRLLPTSIGVEKGR